MRGQLCSDDPNFYQLCGIEKSQVTNDEGLGLCGDVLCVIGHTKFLITLEQLKFTGRYCDGISDCINSDLDEEGCRGLTNINITTLLSGTQVQTSLLCDDVCDIQECEDEAICNGYQYGLWCKHDRGIYYLTLSSICDGVVNCQYGEDEANCSVTNESVDTCANVMTHRIVPIHNYTRCTVIHRRSGWMNICVNYCLETDYCSDYTDQTNCSDPSRVGVSCQINGYMSTVSKYMICLGEQMCDDNIENICLGLSFDCHIHKHLLCDGRQDCDDKKDETHFSCDKQTQQKCKRRFGGAEDLPIPLSWLEDGVSDCIDGRDEETIWPTCGKDASSRFVKVEEICQNVLLCPWDEPSFVELRDLCDGLETCGNENKVCSKARSNLRISTTVLTSDNGLSKHLSFCLKGLKTNGHLKDCATFPSFIFPNHYFFGVAERTSVIVPRELQSCDHMFGELYVYTSCTHNCISSPCPLKNIPRYEVCPEQYPNRIGTVANNKYLAFFTKSFGKFYTNRYFVCDNKIRCIDYSKVCNLVDDCEDGSDEVSCTNHFKCNSTGHYIPKSSKCDGLFDCLDLSDECNVHCSKRILGGSALIVLSWLIGFLAVLANGIIIFKSVPTLTRCNTTVALINKSLIIAISIGDLFVGCDLLIISFYDGIIFREDYCSKQINWITSLECSKIGVLSTVGSQLSLFAMCGLSLTRIYGIYYSMRMPGEVNWLFVLKFVPFLIIMVISSLSIAVIPIVGKFQDFFVNGVNFEEDLKVFIGTPNKQKISGVLESYYGRMLDTKLSWRMIYKMIHEMYSHDFEYPDHTTKIPRVDFYGNDGVCLFKYFVKNDDPQRLFVWIILALNFVCFILITISYLVIGYISQKSSNILAGSDTYGVISERNTKMNQRISIIITTDFLCWIPFIMICLLHSLEVLDATPWYSVFSVIILPINSVINPLIYDNSLVNLIVIPIQRLGIIITETQFYQTLTETLRRLIPSFIQSLRKIWRRSTTTDTGEVGEIRTPEPIGEEGVEIEKLAKLSQNPTQPRIKDTAV